MQPVLIGYFPKRIEMPSGPRIPPHVVQLCHAGHCDGLVPDCWVDAWRHNELWVYDSAALAGSVVAENERHEFEIHGYRLFPVLFVAGNPAPIQLPPLKIDPLPPDYQLIGYDVVSHPYLASDRSDFAKQFGHSSLSPFCNGRCHDVPVNQFCLVDTEAEGFRRAREFSTGDGEPEPYVVLEVWRPSLESPMKLITRSASASEMK
jgi:hypothetical protein